MKMTERRAEIMKLLCRRRHETIPNIAKEFGVSPRTVRRDIEALSLREPIYTLPGKISGGVYVVDGYRMDKMYIEEAEMKVLHKVLDYVQSHSSQVLSDDEITLLKKLIKDYTKPQSETKKRRQTNE